MGKFDGVLLVSDYDATFAMGQNVPPANLERLEYFQAQGGRFTIATGRSVLTFKQVRPLIPFNAPVLLANGSIICDFHRGEILFEKPLPPSVVEDMALLARLRPEMSLEAYVGENDLYVWNTNSYVERHMAYVGATGHFSRVEEMPYPWDKAILEHEHQVLEELQREILARWGDRYEAIFSAEHMLELNPKGCTKGTGVLRLCELLGIKRENVYCVGDNENDISMLEVSALPFAPANAIPGVKAVEGVHLLPPCQEGAIGALIDALDERY